MSRFLSLTLSAVLILALANSQVAYIEGCAIYNQDGCQTCEYAYTLANGTCQRYTNVTADCCAQYNPDGSCSQCSAGLLYSDPYCYRNVITGCVQKSGNTCLTCGLGYILQNGVCFVNIQNCLGYSAAGQCIKCSSGYGLVNAYCVPSPQVANCAQSNYYGCILCSNGYYLTSNRTCLPYGIGCLKYYRENCLVCLPAFNLVSGNCVIDNCLTLAANGCSQCQNGFTLDNGQCYQNNCVKQINGACVACKPAFRLSSNGCVPQTPYTCKVCQQGYVFLNNKCLKMIFGCVSYTASGLCSACSSNFQLTVNGICQILGCQSYNQDGCIFCISPFQLSNNGVCLIANCTTYAPNGCSVCSSGFYLKNSLCFPVDPNCLNYQNSACTQCKPKYHLFNGSCIANERGCSYNNLGACVCYSNFILSSSGKCIIVGCASYDSNDNCLSCSSPFNFNSSSGLCYINYCLAYSENACKTCQTGYFLINGQCQQADPYCLNYNSNGVCTSCQSGFFLNSATGKCVKNIPNCANFFDQVTCQSCNTGFVLFNNSCLSPISNCQTQSTSAFICVKCIPGYHLYLGNCIRNDANCVAYTLQDITENCTTCASGFLLQQGMCVRSQPGCIYSSGKCVNCSLPFLFDPSSNTCFIYGCLSYSASGCGNCNPPFTLINNACVINNCATYFNDGCVKCSPGYSLSSNGLCVSIDINCLTFANNQCTSCKSGYSIVNGKCVIKDLYCVNYGNDGNCLSCAASYYLDINRKCKPKEIGCIYEAGICKYCSSPFELNSLANLCVIKSCLRANASGCLACDKDFVISNGACTILNCNNVQGNRCVQCKVGYHIKAGVYCEIDSSDCLSYDEDGNCQLCKKGLTLTSNAVCSQLNSTCLQTAQDDKLKCLSCASGYFLNKFFQCERQDGKCVEYTNGVCSKCSERYFLFSEICFPYTAGCVQYSGKDCTICRAGYVLKNGECFAWNQQNIGLLGDNDKYNFSITPIDVRQSKYYINNLSPASEIGKFFFSSYFDASYQDCSLSTLNGANGKGWKSATSDSSQYIGITLNGEPATFYALQLESVEGSYISEFYLEYSINGVDFIRVQNPYTVPASIVTSMITIYFTGIYAKSIRIKISKYSNWPACRIDFFYYDLVRFRKISNLKSLKYLQNTINSTFVDRVDNQVYINQAYFFNPTAACSSKEMCFTGLQLCQPHNITSLTLNFGASGVVSEFYLTYSVDGRSYNCFNNCVKIPVDSSANGSFNYSLNNLRALGVRIYPTKYSGNTNFSPIFFYE